MEFVDDATKLQKLVKLFTHREFEKLLAALDFAAMFSIYQPNETVVIDLSASQAFLIALLYGFFIGDGPFVISLVKICHMIVQLKSTYLKIWIKDDFNFKREDLIEIFTKMHKMCESGLIRLPVTVVEPFAALVQKYQLLEYCHEKEDVILGNFVSGFINANNDDYLSIAGVSPPSKAMVDAFSGLPEKELQSRLIKAVQSNELSLIIALINAGANVDLELDNGDTLLHLAVSNGNIGAIRLLLKHGAMPNWRNREYITPLQMAVASNNCRIVEVLVKFGVKVNQPGFQGYTPLHEAALNGNTEPIKTLVGLGASIDCLTRDGQTPLHLAVRVNNLGSVEALLAFGADINRLSENGEAPVHIAVRYSYSRMLKCLIRYGADLSILTKNYMSVLHLARNKEIVKILNWGGADANAVSKEGDTPLHCAAVNGKLEIAKALIACNANIDSLNRKNATPLSVAMKAEQSEIVKLLLASGADVNFKDTENSENSLLHLAVYEKKMTFVRLLLDARININIKNVYNNTPLHYAASTGSLISAQLLIDKGADVNICNHKGETPYRLAALNGHLEIAKLLLEKGARTSSIDTYDDVKEETSFSNGTVFRFGSSSIVNQQEIPGTDKANQNPLSNPHELKNQSSNTSVPNSTVTYLHQPNSPPESSNNIPEPPSHKTLDPQAISAPVSTGEVSELVPPIPVQNVEKTRSLDSTVPNLVKKSSKNMSSEGSASLERKKPIKFRKSSSKSDPRREKTDQAELHADEGVRKTEDPS